MFQKISPYKYGHSKQVWARDCAHVKSALPFHIRENLTGQGFLIWEFGKRSSKLKGGISLPILAQGTFR
jgi:hypothetical protein